MKKKCPGCHSFNSKHIDTGWRSYRGNYRIYLCLDCGSEFTRFGISTDPNDFHEVTVAEDTRTMEDGYRLLAQGFHEEIRYTGQLYLVFE